MTAPKIFYRLLIAALLQNIPLFAQMRVEAITVADGLSQGYVSSLLQDKQGFIWLGTLDGLNRYDGYSIQHFPGKPFEPWSLYTSSSINCLYEDPQHLLWIGANEGLYVFDPLRARFFSLCLPEYHLPSAAVQAITGDSQGNIYVHIPVDTNPVGLFRLHPAADFAYKIRQKEAPVVDMQAARIGTDSVLHPPLTLLQYIGDSMLLAYDHNGRFFRYKQSDNRLHLFDVLTLPGSTTVDHSILWAKNGGYFFRRQLPNGRDTLLPIQQWYSALRLKDGSVGAWINSTCTFLRKNTNAPLITNLSLPKEALVQNTFFLAEFSPLFTIEHYANNVLMIDRSGIFWAGTGGLGVEKITPRKLTLENYLSGHSISTIVELPDGRLWGKLFNESPILINPATRRAEPVAQDPFFKGKAIINLMVDGAGNYWMIELNNRDKRRNSLMLWEKKTNRYTTFPQQFPFLESVPEKMLEDRDGNIWIAAHTGILLRRRSGAQQLEQFSYAQFAGSKLSNFRATTISQDKNGVIWIGTNQGLLRMDGSNSVAPQFTFLQHNQANTQSISLNWVTCVCPDPQAPSIIWIGTRGGGLNRLDTRTGAFSCFSEEPDGLPDNVVYGILPDDQGNLWCSTNHGLCRFNPGQRTFVTYGQSDGALNTEYNTNSYMRSRDGRMWFGGVNGLTVFQPHDVQTRSLPPLVAITVIKVLGVPRLPDEESYLCLPFDQNNVTFSFAVLDFFNPAANRYRYRLKGIDREWLYTGTAHSANYSNLPPGDYVLELQGATADSPWSEPSTTFRLTILTPWYRTWFAWLIYLMGVVAVLAGYIRYRENILKLQYAVATNQRESVQLREFSAFKNRVWANITHEFRTPLTIILGLAARLQRGEQAGDIAAHAQNIAKQGHALLDLTNQILDLAKIDGQHLALQVSNNNVVAFVQQHAAMFAPLAAGKGIHLEVHSDASVIWMDFDPLQLRKIVGNLLANAIRHTPPDGSITIEIAHLDNGQQLSIRVVDTGEGIQPKDLPHIFDRFYQGNQSNTGTSGIGLALAQELVQLMEGKILVESKPGTGSVFSVFLPVTNQAPRLTEEGSGADLYEDPHFTRPDLPENPNLPLLLVIEDSTAIADYLRLFLQSYFRLVFATDGGAGIALALEYTPDIIITDVAMPVKDGYEVTSFLKRDTRTSHIPVVMLTAKVEEEDKLAGHRHGANAYLVKPFHEQELLWVLQNLLELRQQWKNRYIPYITEPVIDTPTDHTAEAVRLEDAFMQNVYAIFEANYPDDKINLDRLCRLLGMSSSQLDRKLSALTNQSPMQMLRSFRLQKARNLLLTTPDLHINEVCFRTGFKTPSHFSRVFAKEFGVAPSEIGK